MISSDSCLCLSYLKIAKSLRRNSCCLTNLSLCSAILSASNSCTLHINAKISLSSSEDSSDGSLCKTNMKHCKVFALHHTSSRVTPRCRHISSFCSMCVLNSDHRSCSLSMSANSVQACCIANSPSASTSPSEASSVSSCSFPADLNPSAVANFRRLQTENFVD